MWIFKDYLITIYIDEHILMIYALRNFFTNVSLKLSEINKNLYFNYI